MLRPFLEIVRSGDTSGPITSVALSALDKFITLELIHPGSPSLIPALQDLSEAGTHCKFEASDSVSDELVLFKIQDVLLHTISGPLGQYLSDEAVCSMMETVLGLCCQMRLSGSCGSLETQLISYFGSLCLHLINFRTLAKDIRKDDA